MVILGFGMLLAFSISGSMMLSILQGVGQSLTDEELFCPKCQVHPNCKTLGLTRVD